MTITVFRTTFAFATLSVVLFLIAACSDSSFPQFTEAPTTANSPPEQEQEPNPVWSNAILGEKLDSKDLIAGASASGSAAIISSNRSKLIAWSNNGDGFIPAEVLFEPNADVQNLSASVIGAVPDGLITVVNRFVSFQPELWFSDDGTSWSQLPAQISERAALVNSIVNNEGVTLLGGAFRSGRFNSTNTAAIWRSEDLMTWTETVPATNSLHAIDKIIATQSGFLALESVRGGALSNSVDQGRTWANIPKPSIPPGWDHLYLDDINYGDSTAVAVGHVRKDSGETQIALFSSSDDGVTWSHRDIVSGKDFGFQRRHKLFFAADAFWVLTTGRREVDSCYIDLEFCRSAPEPVLLRSEDGQQWYGVDLTALQLSVAAEIDTLVATGNGVTLVGTTDVIQTWTWPSGSAPPLFTELEAPQTAPYNALPKDGQIDLGTTYRYPLYVHCGRSYLGSFNGTNWFLEDSSQSAQTKGGPGTAVPHWPTVYETIYGFITLTDVNTIEYSIQDGEVIGIYKSSNEETFFCV